MLPNKDHPLRTILEEIIVWKENPVNIDRVGTVMAMSKVHKRKEEPYQRIAKKMEHASPESGHDSDQRGPK
jgi:hypothetical protein